MGPHHYDGGVGSACLNVDKPLDDFVYAFLTVGYFPNDQVKAAFRQKILVGGVIPNDEALNELRIFWN